MKTLSLNWHIGKTLTAAALATSLAAGPALAAGTYPDTPHASIIAFNQKAKNNTVSIRYAFLPKNGTLAIYAVDRSGKNGSKPLGTVTMKAGDHRDVQISLNSAPQAGAQLRAVIEESGKPLQYSGDVPERTFKIS